MGETSPDSVFASLILNSPSSNHYSSPSPSSPYKSNPYSSRNSSMNQQQQHQQSSSSSYDAPFLNLPSQRSTSAPLESNHVSSDTFQLWGTGQDILDQVPASTQQAFGGDLSLETTTAAGRSTSTGAAVMTSGLPPLLSNHNHLLHHSVPRGGLLHRSASAFGSEAEAMSHHLRHPLRNSHRSMATTLSFLEEERGATAPPSSRPHDEMLWSSSSLSSTTTASGVLRNNNTPHWMMEQSTARSSISHHPPLAAVRPSAKTLMELIQEQDTMQSFVSVNQQQVQPQQQANTTSTVVARSSSPRLTGPPGYPSQPEQRWVLESNTTTSTLQQQQLQLQQQQQLQLQQLQEQQQQQQQQLQQQQLHRGHAATTTTMYQMQPRPQQVILGPPTGDFRVVPASAYANGGATGVTYHAATSMNHHPATSYVSAMPMPQPSHNVYWQQQQQQQQQQHDHHQHEQHRTTTPPSPHYGRSRGGGGGGGPPQRRRPSQPRGGGGRNPNHHHHSIDYNNSAGISNKQHHIHPQHHSSSSPPRNHHNGGVVGGSSLLDEFRSSKRSDWTIPLIVGHIVEFCQDQNGSRFIQQRLELGDGVELVLNEVLPNMHILRIDVFGNYVVQKLLDFGSPEMKMEIRNTLEGEMVSLSLQMYGCRVVQKAFETLPEDQLPGLLSEFHHNVLSLIHDQNGNHVIQKCVEVLNSRAHAALLNGDVQRAEFLWDQVDFIIEDVLVNTKSLSCHPYGCRVFQRMLEHCCEPRKLELLDMIRNMHGTLLDDQYGNYVIQHVLQYGRDDDRDSILSIIEENGLLGLSRQKFASNVVEKLLKYGNSHHRRAVIREMLKKTEDPALHAQSKRVSIVLLMVRDAYANYVVQTTLDVAPESPERRALLYELNSHVEELRNYTFAKHIVAKLTSTPSSPSPGR